MNAVALPATDQILLPAPPPAATDDDAPDWSGVYRVRSFTAEDAAACRDLYTGGLLGGQIAQNDTGLDIDDIAAAYLADPLNHFWVAEVAPPSTLDGQMGDGGAADNPSGLPPGSVVGMIGVQHHDEGVGEIRRLRVHPDHRRRRVGSRLLETAIRFCRDGGCLKVALDTYVERDAALRLFERFRFRHGRTRQSHGKDMLYFYFDFYQPDGGPG